MIICPSFVRGTGWQIPTSAGRRTTLAAESSASLVRRLNTLRARLFGRIGSSGLLLAARRAFRPTRVPAPWGHAVTG